MRLLTLIGLGLFAAVAAGAADLHYAGYTQERDALVIEAGATRVRLRALTANAIEVSYEPDDRQQPATWSVVTTTGPVDATVVDEPAALTFSTNGMRAVIRKEPLSIAFYRGDELLVAEEQGYFEYATLRGFRFRLSAGEKLAGGGERVLGMDRRGHRLPLYNKPHYGYTTASDQMYFGLPAVLSSRKYLLLFDNVARGAMDLGAAEPDVLQFEAVGGRTAYVVVTGDTYPGILEHWTAVTGRQPLPPRWAFGNYASRFGYRTEAEVRDTVQRYIDQDFPLDAVVLDLYWFGPDIKGHMGRLDWDRQAFPDPVGMLEDLERQGVRTILITEPFILSSSTRWRDAVDAGVLARNPAGEPKAFDFYFGHTGLLDVFDERANDWLWDILRGLVEQGVDGWWGDLGEPEVHPADTIHAGGTADELHNAYGHRWAEGLYRRHERDYPDRRPVIMMRSGYAGSQRYGMIPWTGDVSRSWGGLEPQVELALQMGLLGLGYIHSDLGGFADGVRFDRELYVRWLEYGVFQPLFRPHAQEHIASEPVFHDRRTRDLVREYVRLRYRLLPYIYTLAYRNSTTGLPFMRPLSFEDESDPALFDNAESYLWGDAFLVTPVVKPGVRRQAVTLPAGPWFDFWTGRRYEGGGRVTVPAPLDRLPVLVRGGAFVPMTGVISTTRDYSSERLTLHYYADAAVPQADAIMYEDDGHTHRAIERGLYELLHFGARQDGDGLVLSLARDGGSYEGRPARRRIELVIHNQAGPPARLRVGGRDIPVQGRVPPAPGEGAGYDPQRRQLTLRFDWDHRPLAVEVVP